MDQPETKPFRTVTRVTYVDDDGDPFTVELEREPHCECRHSAFVHAPDWSVGLCGPAKLGGGCLQCRSWCKGYKPASKHNPVTPRKGAS